MSNKHQKVVDQIDPVTAWDLKRQIAEYELAAAKAERERRQLLATEQLEVIKTQQAIIAQFLPKGEAKPLEGKVEVDDKVGYVAEVVAYCSLDDLAQKIATDINPANYTILIVDSLDCASGELAWLEITSQFQAFRDQMDKQIKVDEIILELSQPEVLSLEPVTTAAAVLTLAPSVLSLLADIAGYFKTDYTIKGRVVDLKHEALVSAVASHLLETKKCKVYIEKFRQVHKSSIMETFANLMQKAVHLGGLSVQLSDKITRLTDPQELNKAKAAVIETNMLLEEFQRFSTTVAATPDARTYSRLYEAALYAENRGKNPTHLLFLRILSSGGEVVTRRTWVNRSGVMSFMGGLVACYILAETDGTVVSSKTISKLSRLDYSLGTKMDAESQIYEIKVPSRTKTNDQDQGKSSS